VRTSQKTIDPDLRTRLIAMRKHSDIEREQQDRKDPRKSHGILPWSKKYTLQTCWPEEF
jgi:hypothetical protein